MTTITRHSSDHGLWLVLCDLFRRPPYSAQLPRKQRIRADYPVTDLGSARLHGYTDSRWFRIDATKAIVIAAVSLDSQFFDVFMFPTDEEIRKAGKA